MLLFIKLIKLDAFACFNDVSYSEDLQDLFFSNIVYALVTTRSVIFDLDLYQKGALSLPI
jgi:hypothetical protein